MVATTAIGGFADTGSVLPLSGAESQVGVPTLGPILDTAATNTAGMVQIIPTDSTITRIEARFTNSIFQNFIIDTVAVTAQLYTGDPSSSLLTPVPGASCSMNLAGILPVGTLSTCANVLAVPVPAGTPALVVITANSTGIGLLHTVVGFASVSIAAS
jgi:hypothetical protein